MCTLDGGTPGTQSAGAPASGTRTSGSVTKTSGAATNSGGQGTTGAGPSASQAGGTAQSSSKSAGGVGTMVLPVGGVLGGLVGALAFLL